MAGRSSALPLQTKNSKGNVMRLILAIILPFVVFLSIGRPIQGIFNLILQISVIGWLPASIWAVYALSQYKTDLKIAAAH